MVYDLRVEDGLEDSVSGWSQRTREVDTCSSIKTELLEWEKKLQEELFLSFCL